MPNTENRIQNTPPTNKYQLQNTKTKYGTRIPQTTTTKYQKQRPPKQLPKTHQAQPNLSQSNTSQAKTSQSNSPQPSSIQVHLTKSNPARSNPIQCNFGRGIKPQARARQPKLVEVSPRTASSQPLPPSPRKSTQTSRSQPHNCSKAAPNRLTWGSSAAEVSPRTAPSQPPMG